ncbi:MAG: cellulase family glycosylhydrolase [Ktedonobacterales bacterium]|nr:cellulase family glycosylhydrolase [Ktedonobacterales bacterium]
MREVRSRASWWRLATVALILISGMGIYASAPRLGGFLGIRAGALFTRSTDRGASLNGVTFPGPLRVRGTQLVTPAGDPVQLFGTTRVRLDTTWDGSCQGDHWYTVADFTAMRAWHFNSVRLGISPVLWENRANVCPTGAQAYRQYVREAILHAEQAGLYVILTQFLTEPFTDSGGDCLTETLHGGAQYPLPARADSVALWTDLATSYKDDPHVLFDLFNEPYLSGMPSASAAWALWKWGGSLTIDQPPAGTCGAAAGRRYDAWGMQAMVTWVNRLAPDRVVLVGGLERAGSLWGLTHGYALTGTNLVYAIHAYAPRPCCDDLNEVVQRYPVLATEFGDAATGTADVRQPPGDSPARTPSRYNLAVMNYFHQYGVGFLNYSWCVCDNLPGGAFNWGIITDRSGGPSAYGWDTYAWLRDWFTSPLAQGGAGMP